MKKTILYLSIFLFSTLLIGQQQNSNKEKKTFSFCMVVQKSTRHDLRTVFVSNTFSFESNQYSLHKGKGLHFDGQQAFLSDMRVQFFEFLEENYPKKMAKIKDNRYGIVAKKRDATMKPIVLRDWGTKRIPPNPVEIPDNELSELIKVEDFKYVKGKYLDVKKINATRNWYSLNEKGRAIEKRIKEYFN